MTVSIVNNVLQVCPTGIDIRNGTQLECINCTACMDACDAVMDSIGKPRGLIRYASKVSIEEGKSKIFTTRVKFYTAILAILLGVFVTLFANRPTVDVKVLRQRGLVFTELPTGDIRNFYNVTLINKSNRTFKNLKLKVINDPVAKLTVSGNQNSIDLDKEEVKMLMIFIDYPKDKVHGEKKIDIGVYQDGKLLDKYTTVFIAPVK